MHSTICIYSAHVMCHCQSLISFFSFSVLSLQILLSSPLTRPCTSPSPLPSPSSSTPPTFYPVAPFSSHTTLSYPNHTILSYPSPLTTPPYGALLLHPTGVASLPSEATVADSIAQTLATNYNNSGKLYYHSYIITHISLLIHQY